MIEDRVNFYVKITMKNAPFKFRSSKNEKHDKTVYTGKNTHCNQSERRQTQVTNYEKINITLTIHLNVICVCVCILRVNKN